MAVATKQKPKSTPHHKRRHGMHQKRSQHFMNTYWPYIPLLLVVGVGFLINNLLVQANVLGYATDMTPYGLLENTNTQREKSGLGDLQINSLLNQAAQQKANDMATRNYWSHVTPDHQEPWQFINNTGYTYVAAGENLAYGFETSAQAVKGWMNSPEHKANILNQNYSEVGFGVANSPNFQNHGQETVVVAMYAKPAVALANAAQPVRTDQININPAPSEQKIARVQLATSGTAPWSTFATLSFVVLLAVLIVHKHSRAWHKRLRYGQQFIIKHKLLDIIFVGIIMVGFILTRTAGVIH